MKKILFTVLSTAVIVVPTAIYMQYLVYPALQNYEDMFLGLYGVFLFSAIFYLPIFVSQIAMYLCIKYFFFPKEKTYFRFAMSCVSTLLCILLWILCIADFRGYVRLLSEVARWFSYL